MSFFLDISLNSRQLSVPLRDRELLLYKETVFREFNATFAAILDSCDSCRHLFAVVHRFRAVATPAFPL